MYMLIGYYNTGTFGTLVLTVQKAVTGGTEEVVRMWYSATMSTWLTAFCLPVLIQRAQCRLLIKCGGLY